MKVLFVEDEKINISAMKKIVEHTGVHKFFSATTGAEGLAQMVHHPDLIFMDLNLPDTDGLELVKKLRASGVTTPIVAVSAHAMTEDKYRCLDAGCNDYVPKPFTFDGIVNLLEHYQSLLKNDKFASEA